MELRPCSVASRMAAFRARSSCLPAQSGRASLASGRGRVRKGYRGRGFTPYALKVGNGPWTAVSHLGRYSDRRGAGNGVSGLRIGGARVSVFAGRRGVQTAAAVCSSPSITPPATHVLRRADVGARVHLAARVAVEGGVERQLMQRDLAGRLARVSVG